MHGLDFKGKGATIAALLLALIATHIELDIFLPSLSEMRSDFSVSEKAIEWVVGLNFIGFSLSGLFSGFFSDIYGRKKILLIGLGVFFLGSLGTVFSSSFSHFLFFRFLQGVGCGAPVTLSFAAVCDMYPEKKAAQMISVFNGVITASTVSAPILGLFLTSLWGWRANFLFIALFSAIAWLLNIFLFRETKDAAESLSFTNYYQEMKTIIFSSSFWFNAGIAILIFSLFITFIANFPLLATAELHLSIAETGIFQAMMMLTFVCSTFLFAFFVKRFSLNFLTFAAVVFVLAGSVDLVYLGLTKPTVNSLLAAIGCFNVGASILIAIFAARGIHAFKAKGFSSSLMGGLRMGISAAFIVFSGAVYNGTFQPLGLMFLSVAVIITFLCWFSFRWHPQPQIEP